MVVMHELLILRVTFETLLKGTFSNNFVNAGNHGSPRLVTDDGRTSIYLQETFDIH